MNIVCANLLQKALPIKTFIKVYRLFNLQTSTAVRGGGSKALLLIKKALKIPELLFPSFSTVVNNTMLKKEYKNCRYLPRTSFSAPSRPSSSSFSLEGVLHLIPRIPKMPNCIFTRSNWRENF